VKVIDPAPLQRPAPEFIARPIELLASISARSSSSARA
jgi:hypothetical protein